MVDDLMGFRQKVGCADAMSAVKATINYFTHRGPSCVYAAALDLIVSITLSYTLLC